MQILEINKRCNTLKIFLRHKLIETSRSVDDYIFILTAEYDEIYMLKNLK